MRRLIPLICLIVGAPTTGSAKKTAATLTLKISGCRSDRGKVRVALFRSARGFPDKAKKAAALRTVAIKKRRAVVRFPNLPFGEYAAAAYHDENENRKLDRSWLGFPKEANGASNGARGGWGPPKFKDARFKVSASRTIVIKLR